MITTTRPSATEALAPRAGAPCRAAVRPPIRTGHAGRQADSRLSGPPRAVRATPRRRIRLTGRGRLILVLVVSTLLVVAFSIGRASSTATGGAAGHAEPAQFRHVVVQPGDTLWSIARQSVPGADPRVTVQRLIDLNGLRGTAVVPGQQLRLPTGR